NPTSHLTSSDNTNGLNFGHNSLKINGCYALNKYWKSHASYLQDGGISNKTLPEGCLQSKNGLRFLLTPVNVSEESPWLTINLQKNVPVKLKFVQHVTSHKKALLNQL